MSAQVLSFCLFLLWFSVAIFAFVIGPLIYPKIFEDSGRMQFLGTGAGLLALWNFVKWWSLRQRFKHQAYRQEMEEAYRRHTNPPEPEKEKPVIHPEFQF